MESNRKRSGFMKGKLMPAFYRSAAKSAPGPAQYSSSKVVKPNMASPTAASVGFLAQKDLVMKPNQKVLSFVNLPAQAPHQVQSSPGKLNQKQTDHLHTFLGVGADELVDAKAASYISAVQERFKMERLNSERMKHQDSADSLVN